MELQRRPDPVIHCPLPSFALGLDGVEAGLALLRERWGWAVPGADRLNDLMDGHWAQQLPRVGMLSLPCSCTAAGCGVSACGDPALVPGAVERVLSSHGVPRGCRQGRGAALGPLHFMGSA